ncbi:putative drug resistance protein [Diaporthe ampelina]|uniref:Putative drug resistance protein n=1 Tax=Diaporthe ampelina TaxID=1214573 RepID=A0A0G2FA70_9PEZI|nr:putative drug resistance protein [Diaporthe ampelina]
MSRPGASAPVDIEKPDLNGPTLSGQAVVIILPTIGRDIGIPDSRQQWIVSAYALAFGCFLLLWGRIADLYGKRKIFVLGSGWVAVTLAINPIIPNEIAFDLFRGFQGLGAAANVPTALGILGTTFPPGKTKNYAFSMYAAGAPLGSIFGNLLGGLIASYAHWVWVFWTLAILAALVTVAGFFVIPPPPTTLHAQGVKVKATVDWVGAVLITVGLMVMLFALTEGNVVGWRTPWVLVLIVVALAIIAAFVFWQHHLEKTGKQTPLMKVSIFKSGRFSAAMVIMALFFSSFNCYLIYTTYYFQDFQGLSPIQTTLRYIPTGVVGVLTAAITARLIAIIPTYVLLMFGNLCMAVACLLFAAPIPPTTTYFAYGLPAMALSVFGADITWPCMTLFTSHSLPQADQAMGGALVNAVGQFGRAIGLAIATAIQTSVMADARGTSVEASGSMKTWDQPTLKGLQAAQWFDFALGATNLLVVAVAFRGSGIIGKADRNEKNGVTAKDPGRSCGEEGIMNEQNDKK